MAKQSGLTITINKKKSLHFIHVDRPLKRMPENNLKETGLESGLTAPAKRKTTYPRDHPTNPKGAKRTRAEIQQAASDRKTREVEKKKAAAIEKERKLLEAAEKRKLSAKRIAAAEDTVQRSEKERQLHSERPDI